jgi:hypothetical protein
LVSRMSRTSLPSPPFAVNPCRKQSRELPT